MIIKFNKIYQHHKDKLIEKVILKICSLKLFLKKNFIDRAINYQKKINKHIIIALNNNKKLINKFFIIIFNNFVLQYITIRLKYQYFL